MGEGEGEEGGTYAISPAEHRHDERYLLINVFILDPDVHDRRHAQPPRRDSGYARVQGTL